MTLMCASVENRPSLSIPKFVVIAADLAPNSKFKKRLWSHWDTCVTTRPHRPFLHTRFLEIWTERPPKGPQNRRPFRTGLLCASCREVVRWPVLHLSRDRIVGAGAR